MILSSNDSYLQGYHATAYATTVEPEVHYKCTTAYNIRARLNIFDTAGEEQFRAVTRPFYRKSHAVVFVYDTNNKKSFDNLSWWIKEVQHYSDPVIKYLIGNKIDLGKQIDSKKASEFAEKNCFSYFMETSAESGKHIDNLFLDIAERLVEKTIKGLIPDPEEERKRENIIKPSNYDVPIMEPWWMTCFSWVGSLFR